MDVLQHPCGLCLVMDDIEGGDEVVGGGFAHHGQVVSLEVCVGQSVSGGFADRCLNGFGRKVESREPAGTEFPCHQVDRMSTPAAEIGNVCSGSQQLRQSFA